MREFYLVLTCVTGLLIGMLLGMKLYQSMAAKVRADGEEMRVELLESVYGNPSWSVYKYRDECFIVARSYGIALAPVKCPE